MEGRDRADGARDDEVLLADGSWGHVRRLAPGDRDGVDALVGSCSEASLYTRFFTLGRATVGRYVDHVFDEESPGIAYVLQRDGRIIGLANVEPVDEETGEIAFLVADDAHGCGVATLLLERAAEDARSAGIRWFVADVLASNHLMLQVFADAGFRIERRRLAGEVSVRMSTDDTSVARAARVARQEAALARRAGVGRSR